MSGKVDKSAALMSFGLALMQNRAGKGFNLGRMMRSVGEAGEVALPKLEAAKKEARAAAIEGGKFALTSQRADKASARAAAEKSMERGQYYIYEKGGEGTPFEKFDKGQLSHLSKYELNELMKNPDFDKNYAFVTASDYFDIMKGQAKETDLGNAYGKETQISLLGGDIEDIPPMYIVDGQIFIFTN